MFSIFNIFGLFVGHATRWGEDRNQIQPWLNKVIIMSSQFLQNMMRKHAHLTVQNKNLKAPSPVAVPGLSLSPGSCSIFSNYKTFHPGWWCGCKDPIKPKHVIEPGIICIPAKPLQLWHSHWTSVLKDISAHHIGFSLEKTLSFLS